VREALVWLGEADPCLTVEAITSDDPERMALVAVITQWEEYLGVGGAYTCSEMVTEAERVRFQISAPGSGLYDALLEACGTRGGNKLVPKLLSEWLRLKAQGNVVAGRQIVHVGERGGSKTWKLVKM